MRLVSVDGRKATTLDYIKIFLRLDMINQFCFHYITFYDHKLISEMQLLFHIHNYSAKQNNQ